MWDFDNGWFNRFLPAVPMTDICKYLFIKDLGFLPTVEMTGQFVQKIEGKDGGEAAIFSSHNIHLAVTPTKEDSYKKKPLSKFETLTKITSQRNNAQPINSRALSHYALCIMHS